MILKWNEALYGTGFEKIDKQHKELFDGINELLAACTTGLGSKSVEAKENTEKMIDFLADYVIEHFECEEDCMQTHQCAMLNANRAAHKHFMKEFSDIKERIEQDGITRGIIIRLEGLLVGWFSKHIQKIDASLRNVVPETAPEPEEQLPPPTKKKRGSFFSRLWKGIAGS